MSGDSQLRVLRNSSTLIHAALLCRTTEIGKAFVDLLPLFKGLVLRANESVVVQQRVTTAAASILIPEQIQVRTKGGAIVGTSEARLSLNAGGADAADRDEQENA